MKVKGKALTTIAGGKVVWHNDKLTTEQGHGKYVEREMYGFPFERIGKLDSKRDAFE